MFSLREALRQARSAAPMRDKIGLPRVKTGQGERQKGTLEDFRLSRLVNQVQGMLPLLYGAGTVDETPPDCHTSPRGSYRGGVRASEGE